MKDCTVQHGLRKIYEPWAYKHLSKPAGGPEKWSASQSQSYFSKFQKSWHFGKVETPQSACAEPLNRVWPYLLHIYLTLQVSDVYFSLRQIGLWKILSSYTFIFMFCHIVKHAVWALFPWKHQTFRGTQSSRSHKSKSAIFTCSICYLSASEPVDISRISLFGRTLCHFLSIEDHAAAVWRQMLFYYLILWMYKNNLKL